MPSIVEKRGLPGLSIDTKATKPSSTPPSSAGMYSPTSPTTPYSPLPTTPQFQQIPSFSRSSEGNDSDVLPPSSKGYTASIVDEESYSPPRYQYHTQHQYRPTPQYCADVTEEPREIIMGGLVTRSVSGSRRSSEDSAWDEKRAASIEVPGIVLTEPHPDPHPQRTRTPPPKSILLLPPTSLPLPDPNAQSTFGTIRKLFSYSSTPSLASHTRPPSRRSGCIPAALKSVVLLSAFGLGAWHLYATFSSGTWVDEMSGLVEEVVQ